MDTRARFADYSPDDNYPVLTLARVLDLEGATVYIVDEDGIHEGTFVDQENDDIIVTDEHANEEIKVHASKVHLFLRDAEHHYRALARDTNWGTRAGD